MKEDNVQITKYFLVMIFCNDLLRCKFSILVFGIITPGIVLKKFIDLFTLAILQVIIVLGEKVPEAPIGLGGVVVISIL